MARAPGRLPTLSPKETLILELLIAREDMYGLELVSASRRRLKRGTIYVTLARMEDKGFVTSRLEDPPADSGGLPRRRYRPTALGRRVFETWTQVARRLMPEFAK
jgi:DNA-binding PadR family transcriptional regulator